MMNKRLKKGSKAKKQNIQSIFAKIWENDFGYIRSAVYFTSNFFLELMQKFSSVRTHAFSISAAAFAIMISAYVLFPTMVNADMTTDQKSADYQTATRMVYAFENEMKPFGTLPVSETAHPRKLFTIPITAYTSEVGQTDDTPCITASGMNVCERATEDVVAANFLPMGTRVRIPELYGDRIFTVQDRMNARYNKHMDVWLKDLKQAKQFGLKYTKIEVF